MYARLTALAQRVVFSVVLADAALVSRLASADLAGVSVPFRARPPRPSASSRIQLPTIALCPCPDAPYEAF